MTSIIYTLMLLFLIAVFGRIILSWFPVAYDSPLASVNGVLFTITEPVLGPLRRVLPMVQFGGAALDLSPIVVIVAYSVLSSFICG